MSQGALILWQQLFVQRRLEGGPKGGTYVTFAKDAVRFQPPLTAAVLGKTKALRELALHAAVAVAALLFSDVYPKGRKTCPGTLACCHSEQDLSLPLSC